MKTHLKLDFEAGKMEVIETREGEPPVRVQPVVRPFRVRDEPKSMKSKRTKKTKAPRRVALRAVVRRVFPDAYCVRLDDGSGYIVWPGKIQGRGFEHPAIGLGKTAREAWASVNIPNTRWLKQAVHREKQRAAKRICKHCGGPGANIRCICECCADYLEIIQAPNIELSNEREAQRDENRK